MTCIQTLKNEIDIFPSNSEVTIFHDEFLSTEIFDHVTITRKTILSGLNIQLDDNFYRRCLFVVSIRFKDIEIGVRESPVKTLIFKKNNYKLGIFVRSAIFSPENVGLYTNDIIWEKCPHDLFEGIDQIIDSVAASNDHTQLKNSIAIQAQDCWVAGTDGNISRRYKLSGSLPFDMNIEGSILKPLLPKLRKRDVIRIAEHEYKDEFDLICGFAFDLGEFRIFIPKLDYEEILKEITSGSYKEWPEPDTEYWKEEHEEAMLARDYRQCRFPLKIKNLVPLINGYFDTPCQILIKLPKTIKQSVKPFLKSDFLSLIIENDTLRIVATDDHGDMAANAATIGDYSSAKGNFLIEVPTAHFYSSIDSDSLMGFKSTNQINALSEKDLWSGFVYIKGKNRETIITGFIKFF